MPPYSARTPTFRLTRSCTISGSGSGATDFGMPGDRAGADAPLPDKGTALPVRRLWAAGSSFPHSISFNHMRGGSCALFLRCANLNVEPAWLRHHWLRSAALSRGGQSLGPVVGLFCLVAKNPCGGVSEDASKSNRNLDGGVPVEPGPLRTATPPDLATPGLARPCRLGWRQPPLGLTGLGRHKGPAMEDDLDGGLASDDY